MGLGRQHKIPCCFRANFSNVGYGQRSCVVKGTVGNSFTKNSAVVRDTVDTRRSKKNGLLQQMTTTARVQMRFCICGLDGLEDPMFSDRHVRCACHCLVEKLLPVPTKGSFGS